MKKHLLALIFLLALATSSWADTYYCILFAYDSTPVSIPCKCHIWGTFVKMDDYGKVTEEISLSWEPDKISYTDRPRPGYHSSLQNNLETATRNNRTIRMWGPFETDKDFYDKAKSQYESPGRYKFFDCTNRNKHQNCIHRLSDVAGAHRTGVYWGWWATESVVKHYYRRGVIRDSTNETVIRLVHIDKYPVRRMRAR